MSNKSKKDGQIIRKILSNQDKEKGIQDYASYELFNCKFSMIENQKQFFEKRTSRQTKHRRFQ